MKKLILVLAFPLFATFSYGQAKRSIDFLIGLEYSDLRHDYKNVNPDFLQYKEERNAKLHGMNNYRFGFNWNIKLRDKIYFKSGLRFFRTGYSSGKSTVNWAVPDPTKIKEVEYIYKYYFLELPIVARYHFVEKKLTPFIEVGLAPSYYLGSQTTKITDLYTFENKNAVDGSFNKLQIVGLISIGANYALNHKLQLFVQPTYRVHINSIRTEKNLFFRTNSFDLNSKDSFSNFGIELGLRRMF